ncbi:hypothetical protein EVG20_g7010 [Dentipellis fragilis]|uniref:F-box domain-containing protein n=1 Tax=Dentipellis fragilis TaxID=205917 RepID=A0A4Y9YG81_9AGAM|nr:hypothetical protein EVG20_g7010 [Dentipellis fragilis]
MSKRPLSPATLPPSKRVHISWDGAHESTPRRTFDTLLYDELVLHIFSYLPWEDLCAVQATNRNWFRLSADNQLWKSLYLTEYGRSRLRGGRGFVGRTDGREVKPLPGRAHSDEVKNWKAMFRISTNWRTGRCDISKVEDDMQALAQTGNADIQTMNGAEQQLAGKTHMLLTGHFTIIASSQPSISPAITFISPTSHTTTIHAKCLRVQRPIQITALAVDQSPPSTSFTRIAVCLSNGELQVFEQHGVHLQTSSRKHYYIPPARTPRTTPILQVAYHHPVLATLSEKFHLSIYDVSSESMKLTHCLTSFTCFPPASMVLSSPEPSTHRLVLTYASPVYPKHWSVGVTEVILNSAPSSLHSTSSDPASAIRLISTRSTRAFDLPPGWLDTAKLAVLHEQWGRKVFEVAGTQTDGRWVILAPSDSVAPNTPSTSTTGILSPFSSMPLQLYRISFPSATANSSATPKLTFVRNLHGHTGPTAALALADGRCVSVGHDGSIWVWDLEAGTGAEVAPARDEEDEDSIESMEERWALAAKATVVFDERRIINAGVGGVVVRNFDI